MPSKKRTSLIVIISVLMGLMVFSTTGLAAEGKEKLKKGINQRVEDLENLIGELGGKIAQIQSDLTALKETANHQAEDVSALKQTVDNQNHQIEDLVNDVAVLKSKVEQLESQGEGNPNEQLTVTGQVTKQDGTPVQGAAIKLTDDGGYYGAVTDTEGKYKIDVRKPGTYPLIVVEKGYLVAHKTNVTITSGAAATANLVMVEGGTIAGQVSFGNGVVVGYVSIKVLDENNSLVNRINVNADGSYHMNAGEGTYTLLLEASGGRTQTETVTVVKGETGTQNFLIEE